MCNEHYSEDAAQKGAIGYAPKPKRCNSEGSPADPKRDAGGSAEACTRTHANVVPAYILRKGNRPRLFRRTYVIIGKMIPFEELGYDPEAPAGEYARITGVIFDRVCGLGEEFAASHSKKKKK